MSYYNLLKESSTKKIIIMSHIQLLEGKLGKPEGMEGQISIEGKKIQRQQGKGTTGNPSVFTFGAGLYIPIPTKLFKKIKI